MGTQHANKKNALNHIFSNWNARKTKQSTNANAWMNVSMSQKTKQKLMWNTIIFNSTKILPLVIACKTHAPNYQPQAPSYYFTLRQELSKYQRYCDIESHALHTPAIVHLLMHACKSMISYSRIGDWVILYE